MRARCCIKSMPLQIQIQSWSPWSTDLFSILICCWPFLSRSVFEAVTINLLLFDLKAEPHHVFFQSFKSSPPPHTHTHHTSWIAFLAQHCQVWSAKWQLCAKNALSRATSRRWLSSHERRSISIVIIIGARTRQVRNLSLEVLTQNQKVSKEPKKAKRIWQIIEDSDERPNTNIVRRKLAQWCQIIIVPNESSATINIDQLWWSSVQ